MNNILKPVKNALGFPCSSDKGKNKAVSRGPMLSETLGMKKKSNDQILALGAINIYNSCFDLWFVDTEP